jgi:ribosomal protein S18 acetylase RimI-like enzyme
LPGFTFIEHFAIKESIRGKGIGSKAIRLITETKSPRVILEVEEPTDKLARRRIAFYKRLGFSVCKNTYWQPPYSPEKKKVKMLLMSFPDKIQSGEFMEIKKHIYLKVYQLEEFLDLE